jgi:hypothetical protein
MRANIVDLRYRMKHILQALDRNETVTIIYHGKEKGTIIPPAPHTGLNIIQHPFFGMTADNTTGSVEDTMKELRGNRY